MTMQTKTGAQAGARGAAGAGLALGLALTLAACGGGGIDTSSQESLAEGFASALADGDAETICSNVEGEKDWERLTKDDAGWDRCVEEVEGSTVSEEDLEGEPSFDDAYVRWGGGSILTHEDPDGAWIINVVDLR